MRRWVALLAILIAVSSYPQTFETLNPDLRKYVRVGTSKIVLEHVEVIDGTGAAAMPDRNVVIENGKIAAITPGADATPSDGTTILDLRGYSVMPGIVGMHDHFFCITLPDLAADNNYERPGLFHQMTFSAPRLYLANGVTTARTAGSIEPQTDVRIKDAIEHGTVLGPHLDVTGPYLDGVRDNRSLQMGMLRGADDASETVAYWANRGVTSFKAYAHITRDELRAAVAEAHKHRSKVTGHLCSVTYPEAIDAGIDNLEHGFSANTQDDPDKKPDVCSASSGDATLEAMEPGGPAAKSLIEMLISHHVAITSTLPNGASGVPNAPPVRAAAVEAMAPSVRDMYFFARNRVPPAQSKAAMHLRREMDLEREFVAAGGLLIAGPDPVGIGGNVPGFGDQREIELLVDAGFTAVDAIRIATLNGATYLGRQNEIGSIAAGKNADIVVMKGDPATHVNDIENVEIVFKDGVGYDTKKILESVKERYGAY